MNARTFFTYVAAYRYYSKMVAEYYAKKKAGNTDAGDEIRIRGYIDAKKKYEADIDEEIDRYRELSGNPNFGKEKPQ